MITTCVSDVAWTELSVLALVPRCCWDCNNHCLSVARCRIRVCVLPLTHIFHWFENLLCHCCGATVAAYNNRYLSSTLLGHFFFLLFLVLWCLAVAGFIATIACQVRVAGSGCEFFRSLTNSTCLESLLCHCCGAAVAAYNNHYLSSTLLRQGTFVEFLVRSGAPRIQPCLVLLCLAVARQVATITCRLTLL